MIDQSMQAGTAKVKLYISAILWLCGFVIVAILGITFLKPESDNLPLIGLIIGLFAPIVTALIAAALKENHDAMNSRLSQLLVLTSKSAKAEGKLEGP